MSVRATIASIKPALGMLILETKSLRCSITSKTDEIMLWDDYLLTFSRSVLAVQDGQLGEDSHLAEQSEPITLDVSKTLTCARSKLKAASSKDKTSSK